MLLKPSKCRPSATGGITGLCPACFEPAGGHHACARCRTEVKSPLNAALRSLLLPGLGDFYLGHRFLASLEMIGSLASWFIVVGMVLPTLGPDSTQPAAVVAVTAAAILLLVNGFDALLTYAQAKKGLHSMDRHPPTTPAAGHLVADRPRAGVTGMSTPRPN